MGCRVRMLGCAWVPKVKRSQRGERDLGEIWNTLGLWNWRDGSLSMVGSPG